MCEWFGVWLRKFVATISNTNFDFFSFLSNLCQLLIFVSFIKKHLVSFAKNENCNKSTYRNSVTNQAVSPAVSENEPTVVRAGDFGYHHDNRKAADGKGGR